MQGQVDLTAGTPDSAFSQTEWLFHVKSLYESSSNLSERETANGEIHTGTHTEHLQRSAQ